ncbi:MAG: glycosyltransferase [Gemmatimonadales bacterium]
MSGPKVSIAVCTFNRSALLAQVLSDLSAQLGADRESIEVLVVDNNSTDSTQDVLRQWAHRLPLRVVVERAQGNTFARNRALREAVGEYLIFLDDDVRLCDGWYSGYLREMVSQGRTAVAGAVESTWPKDVPAWVGDTRSPPFPGVTVHFVPGDEPTSLGAGGPLPFTANLGVRLDLARNVGFREDLGHIGGKPIGGEDMDFCRRFILQFGTIRYEPTIRVFHPVDESRLTLRHTFKYLFRGAMAEAWYDRPVAGKTRFGPIPIWLVRFALTGCLNAFGGVLTMNPRRVVSGCGRVVRAGGMAWGLLHPRADG